MSMVEIFLAGMRSGTFIFFSSLYCWMVGGVELFFHPKLSSGRKLKLRWGPSLNLSVNLTDRRKVTLKPQGTMTANRCVAVVAVEPHGFARRK
ncbi:hypothetical protein C0Q70_18287 [Pomacea canaliculata]|uniref:Uncharacterized protein n=1 Tax=Pomacea canaliculata TaxID=400727 RepID=A0A2T7NMT7_POMCA|nr:hypothetical protein C0Q70_18287 [Pomacea canaliculata]